MELEFTDQDQKAMSEVNYLLRKREVVYLRYRKRLLRMESCRAEETLSRKTEKIQLMCDGFYKENLAWISKLIYTGPVRLYRDPTRLLFNFPIPLRHSSMLSPMEDFEEIFCRMLNPMDYAVLIGDIEFQTLFVKYGLCEQKFCSNPNWKSVLYIRAKDINSPPLIRNPMDTNRDSVERSKEFITAKLEIFSFAIYANRLNLLSLVDWIDFFYNTTDLMSELYLTGGRMLSSNQRGFRRILLNAKLLDALKIPTTAEYRNFDDRIMSLKLYFRTIKDPFICKQEFQEFLSFFLKGMTENTIKSLVEDYESLFQENVTSFAPRSLKHLCRCTLRSTFMEKYPYLPDIVSSLRYPDSIKRYIYGQL